MAKVKKPGRVRKPTAPRVSRKMDRVRPLAGTPAMARRCIVVACSQSRERMRKVPKIKAVMYVDSLVTNAMASPPQKA